MKAIIFSLLVLLNLPAVLYGQTTTKNYVKSTTAMVSMTDSLGALSEDEVSIQVAYYDGLGRPDQTVIQQQAPDGKDVVTVQAYDAYGRPYRQYLPYKSSASDGSYRESWGDEIAAFYQDADNDVAVESSYFYSETRYEASPLNRPSMAMSPGAAWVGSQHGVTSSYGCNAANEIYCFYVGDEGTITTSDATYYDSGQLFRTMTTDEDDHQVVEFKDKAGQVICKWAYIDSVTYTQTYYLYDDFGLLRYVIQPEGVTEMGTDFSVLNAVDFRKSWMFQYRYDGRQRMVMKQVPGADSVRMLYDQRDRLVLTQDGNQRETNSWLFTKYDIINRPVITGTVTFEAEDDAGTLLEDYYASVITTIGLNQIPIKLYLDTDSLYYEERDTDGDYGYTDKSFPDLDSYEHTVYSVSYYDDYSVLEESHFNTQGGRTYDFSYQTDLEEYSDNDADLLDSPKGSPTATRTRILGTDQFEATVTYYDWKLRPIQVLNLNQYWGLDRVSSSYDFIGNVLTTQEYYALDSLNGGTYTINKWFSYDHANRLTASYQQIADGSKQLITQNNYNAIGQLIEKNLHAADPNNPTTSNYLQSVDYRYNIRGWLQNINTPTTEADGDFNTDELVSFPDVFGMELIYVDSED